MGFREVGICGAQAGRLAGAFQRSANRQCMILRNHGTLAVGNTCADAFMAMYYLERACTMQIRALAGGAAVNPPPQGAPEKAAQQSEVIFNGVVGPIAWEALLRKMDRLDPGYRT
jgi:ribulose-5-phosphate 4-epimerase/fuculose-1-phosphate aldolase